MADDEKKVADSAPKDFIRAIIAEDVARGKNGGRVATRFPPEPNGYLHIGHAKAIWLNFGVAQEYEGGTCNLRFDDTNPEKESEEYVQSIQEDIRWLGFDWGDRLYFASDYFEQLYGYAEDLIRAGKAYVDSLSAAEIREYRGTLTEPGKNSPHRDRSIEENLDLFRRMRAGEFPDGAHVLRAKIDMASPNITLRDPTLYRIKRVHHHRTGDEWCIYPMYDFTHCLSDAIEGITHSICTLEFENNRALYDWVLDQLDVPSRPRQYEFAKLLLTQIMLSKRNLLRLIQEGHVTGWDDPRMPTLRAMRRLGYPPEAIRALCERVGVSKKNSLVDIRVLEQCVREHHNRWSPRVMGVLDPLEVVLTTYPEGRTEEFDLINNPEDPSAGTRKVPFSRTLYIEREDFMEDPPRKFFRLAPGREVRLRGAYFITCDEVVRDPETGRVVQLRCSHDPASRGGASPDGRRVKGTLHWVSSAHALPAEVRLYEQLFTAEVPGAKGDFHEDLNPNSLTVLKDCKVEPSLAGAAPESTFQFERKGYFCVDNRDSTPDHLVFNRTVTLRDSWAKLQGQQKGRK